MITFPGTVRPGAYRARSLVKAGNGSGMKYSRNSIKYAVESPNKLTTISLLTEQQHKKWAEAGKNCNHC